MQRINETDNSINFYSVLQQFVKYWYIFLIVFVLCISGFFIGAKLTIKPQYTSSSKLYIFNSENQNVSTSEITLSTYLTRDYIELISDRAVLEEVINNLHLDCSYTALKGSIKINNPENTRMLVVSVKNTDPKLAQEITNEVCNVAKKKIIEIMGVDRVNTVSVANLPTTPDLNPERTGLIYGFLSTVLIWSALLLFLVLTNNKLETEEEVFYSLGLNTLGTIPYSLPKAKIKKRR